MFGFLTEILKSPLTMVIAFNILLGVGGAGYYIWKRITIQKNIIYFSENERLFEVMKVDDETPTCLINNKFNYRFFRSAPSWTNTINKNVIWLAKRGTAYLFRLNEDEKDKAKPLGTLWEGLKTILGDELVNDFTDEVKDKLRESTILLTVSIEKPEMNEGLPELTEEDIQNDTVFRMSQIMFSGIKDAIQQDHVKFLMTLGTGALLYHLALSLGLL